MHSDQVQPFYTPRQIDQLRTACQFYELTAPAEFWTKTADELSKVCNGAGPDRWSELKRRALTCALKPYEPAFAIHDVEYEYRIGSQKISDRRLKKNMVRIWRKNFGFWRFFSIGAWIERFKVIPFVFIAVTVRGGRAWEK